MHHYDSEAIVNSVERALNDAFRELNGRGASDQTWTRKIKEKLCAREYSLEYERASSNAGEHVEFGEWLFDLCWLDYGKVGERYKVLKGVPLVVESEWGNQGDVEDDFEKLMVGRAAVKLLVYDGRDGAAGKIPTRLASLLCAFSHAEADDLYVLAAYTDQGFQFEQLGSVPT